MRVLTRYSFSIAADTDSNSSAGPEKKTKEVKYEAIDLCKFPVFMEVGHFVQIKECNKREIKLVQVDCESIGKDGGDFPCYKGCDVIEVRANFPAILNASLNKSGPIRIHIECFLRNLSLMSTQNS